MSDTGGTRLGIVVVSYGSADLLRQHLRAIERTALPPCEVVVVDNPTTPAERRAVRTLAAEHGWHVVEPETNVGFGAGMNVGAQRALDAGCSVLLCLNPDVAITGADIAALVEVLEERPGTLISPRLLRVDGTTWFAGGQIDLRVGTTTSRPDVVQRGPARWLTGACLLVDRASWELLGGFDERYFLYWEDIDLSQRMLRHGGELLVWHDVCATHEVGATQRQQRKTPLYVRCNCRNRLLFAATHLAWRDRLRWLAHSPRYAARVLLRDGRRAALGRPEMWVAAAWGTAQGVGLVATSLAADGARRLRGR